MSPRLSIALAPLLVLSTLIGCGKDEDPEDEGGDEAIEEPEEVGVAVLGAGTHDPDSVTIAVIADEDDGDLDEPLDLAFNPRAMDQLWVVNYASSATTIILDPGTDDQTAERFRSTGSNHFFASPASLAFSDFGNWASAQDTDALTQGNATPADFMGPVLWDDNLDKFDSGHGSHLDMLHNSPLGGGIAWDYDNVYWYFDGYHESITRYDFASDHGYGGADHSDHETLRYAEGSVQRIEGVPSHMELDRDSGLLYIADTSNNRIAILDTTSGEVGSSIRPNYDGGIQKEVEDAELWTLVDGPSLSEVSLEAPAGLAIHDDLIFVGDYSSGYILAFDFDGELVDWLDTGRGADAIGGIDFDADGNLWFTDIATSEILRISVD